MGGVKVYPTYLFILLTSIPFDTSVVLSPTSILRRSNRLDPYKVKTPLTTLFCYSVLIYFSVREGSTHPSRRIVDV